MGLCGGMCTTKLKDLPPVPPVAVCLVPALSGAESLMNGKRVVVYDVGD